MSINRVIIEGRLTREPELRVLPSGMAVTTLSMANNRRYKVRNEDREETTFIDVTVFGNTANACAEHLRKGSKFIVEGRLKTDQWEKDGKKHSKTGIVADNVTFMDAHQPAQGATRQAERATDDPPPRHAAQPSPQASSEDDTIPF